jgi:hypothetical protein
LNAPLFYPPQAIYEHRRLLDSTTDDDGFMSDADTGVGQSMTSSRFGNLSSLGAGNKGAHGHDHQQPYASPYYQAGGGNSSRRMPESLMSTGHHQEHGGRSVSYRPWRMPEKLQVRQSFFSFPLLLAKFVNLIDCKCEDGLLPVSTRCVTISNPDSLSSSETVINPGIRS